MVLRRLLCVVALLMPAPLAAQLPPLGMPGGTMRIEVHAGFGGATDRYVDGTREDLGADLTSPAFGSDRLAELAEPDARIASLTGNSAFRLSLGRSDGYASNSRAFGALGLSLGVSNAITLFGRVPFVNVVNRRQLRFAAGTEEAGVNTASPVLGDAAGQSAAAGFFTSFDAALTTLEGNIAGGVYAGDPAQEQLAQETLASGIQLRDSLRALVLDEATAASFLPLSSTAAGAALAQRVTGVQQTLSTGLGVGGFDAALPLPSTAATFSDLERLALATNGAYAYQSYTAKKIMGIGDAEVGAVLTLVDRWDRGGLGGFRLAAEALVRLPTGGKISPDDAWPGATGDGQMDVEVNAAADVGTGSVGMRLHGGYQVQLSSTVSRRVAAPGNPFVPAANLADVELDPGDVLSVGATPFVRLARPLAAHFTVMYRKRSEDAVSYAGAAVPGVDVGLLAQQTAWSMVTWGVGLSYAEIGGRAGSRARVPIDASWWYEAVATASDGRVAAGSVMRLQLRYYVQLW
ncbi:MAG TPA: hypothetical protein VFX50_00315 [Gemmatimonadales bacterium]|nr:hypothetical protein [Gemmatimonadales bacterium]